MTALPPQVAAVRTRGLRANALAAIVTLLVQYCLGISINLYSTLPARDRGKSLFAGFGSAVGNGPLILSLHALLGTLLLIGAVAAVIRSSRLGAPPLVVLAAVALVAIVSAWLAGSEFVGHMKNGTSLAMALATALAILCYTLILFLLALAPRSGSSRREQAEAT